MPYTPYDCSRKRNVLTVGSIVPRQRLKNAAEEYMKLTNIEELSHKKSAHSGGQQRVAITGR